MPQLSRTLAQSLVLTAGMATGFGCDDGPATPPSAPLEAPRTVDDGARSFAISKATSNVEFLMEAPIEHIRGRAPGSVEGDFSVTLDDLRTARGLIRIDLEELTLFQTKKDEDTGEWSPEAANPAQNRHMRTWLQISDDAPAEVRSTNRWIEFSLESVATASATDISAMTGNERRVIATIQGQFRLHGRTVEKAAQLEIIFHYEGDTPHSVHVRSTEPIPVDLEAHDVRPRSAFDQLAEKTLAALGEKVAAVTPVTIDFTAELVADGAGPNAASAPAGARVDPAPATGPSGATAP